MEYYAHTAEGPDGKPLPEKYWQPLTVHLRNVADLAKQFAAPLGLAAEAELAGLLHDLGKYAERFQERLHNPSIHGINHWSVGAFRAWELGRVAAALAVEGHHTGIPALKTNYDRLECWAERYKKLHTPTHARVVNGFTESLAELHGRFVLDGFALPAALSTEKAAGREFRAAMKVRLLFSCLVDADFLDTEQHFDAAQAGLRGSPELQESAALRLLLEHLGNKPTDGAVNQLRRSLFNLTFWR